MVGIRGSHMARVLVIEDEESLRRLYSQILAAKNYTVETAEDGKKALEKLTLFKPDIIVLDIVMPNFNGMEFLKVLKNNHEYKSIPVLMLSALSDMNKIRECLDIGAVGYITKESSVEEMAEKLNMVLDSLSVH